MIHALDILPAGRSQGLYLNHPGPFPLDRREMALVVWSNRRRVIESWKGHAPNDDEFAAYDRAWEAYDAACRELTATSPYITNRSEAR